MVSRRLNADFYLPWVGSRGPGNSLDEQTLPFVEHGSKNQIMIGCYAAIGREPKYCRTISSGTSASVGFCDIECTNGRQKIHNLLIVCAFMGLGLGIGLALGLSMRNSMIGDYFGFAFLWALGSIAAIGRIRKNRRFARIDKTGVAY